MGNLGVAYADLQQMKRAITYYEQALVIRREIGNRYKEGLALGNLGNAYAELGQMKRALEYYEHALAIQHEIGDRRNEGIILGNLGWAYAELGQVERAIEYYEQALSIAREIGDRIGAGEVLSDIGGAFWKQGKLVQATDAWEQAKRVYAAVLAEQPDDLEILAKDAALAVLQGDLSHLQARIEVARAQISSDNQLFVLLPFFDWLAQPEQGWEPVMTALEETKPKLSFHWNFFIITPAIERQDEKTQQIARHFIAFFEGKIDLPTLKTRLAELQD